MADRRTTSIALLLAAAPLFAALPGPVVDDQDRMVIPNSAHRRLVGLDPVRAVAPETPLERMILVLKMAPEASSSLKQLLKDQQDPASASYHQWLTPDDFGKRFGPTQAQRDAASLWLLQQGFSLQGIAKSGTAITFSGTAGQVGKAFRTAIMEYQVNGVTHHGNATNLSIPRGLAGFVSGVATMHDLYRTPRPRLLGKAGVKTFATDGYGNPYMGPGDFAAIYNLNPLFTQGLTGNGVTIGVVGQTDVALSDFNGFRQQFGMTGGSLTIIDNGADPGLVPTDQPEASIDTQWASAAAPGAAIKLVASPSSLVSQGVDLSALYLVDNNVAPIISMSYGECETDMGGAGSTYVTFYEQLWAQAAGQGISVFVSAGDSGAAGCDDADAYSATQGLAVSGLASTPYNTCVGGTMLSTGSAYWSGGSTQTTQTTAKGYVPEQAWDESSLVNGFRLFGGGGGVSICWPKPAWQSAPGVPTDRMRDVPDVSLNASVITSPTAVMLDGSLQEYGGTSVAAPCMAGIMALVVQKYGRQGNPNPTLYSLGSAQYGGSGPAVFHDITSGNNSVPGQAGYSAGTGYDLATGLGSVDATLLVNNWVTGTNPIQVSLSTPTLIPIVSGQSVTFSGSATDATPGATLSYLWSFGDGNPTPAQASTYSPSATATHTYYATGTATQVYTANLVATDGNNVQSSGHITVQVSPTGVNPVITLPVAASFAFPGVPIAFAGAATTQNQGQITSYSWDFGDGTKASGSTATHAFAENSTGYFNVVTLTATDSTGATGQTTALVLSDRQSIMDLNGDSSIDVRDLLTLATAWSSTPANSTQFNGLEIWGDLNADGVVNDEDLNLWISNFTPVAP